jgi:hypothetical protein
MSGLALGSISGGPARRFGPRATLRSWVSRAGLSAASVSSNSFALLGAHAFRSGAPKRQAFRRESYAPNLDVAQPDGARLKSTCCLLLSNVLTCSAMCSHLGGYRPVH